VAGHDAADGTPFGRYRLIELLGRGGMGEVWRAHDTETDRIVAIKLLPPHFSDNEDFERRFRREAHAAARLNTPHVVPIHNYGEIDGRLYVDMRLVEGRDLETVLRDGPLEPSRAARIIEGVALALHAAHEVGLLHRDVKPSNILLDKNDFAYLIDFGIARAADETRLTKSGNTIGTFAYIAPERLGTRAEEDARADIYSLACVLYECLTGSPPFDEPTMAGLVAAHLSTPPPRPSTARPDIPEHVDEVIATGMAKDPDQRFATTVELADAARDAITVPNQRRAPAATVVPKTQQARNHVPAQPRTVKGGPSSDIESPRPQPASPIPASVGGGSRSAAIALIVGIFAFLAVAAAVGISSLVKHAPPEASPTPPTIPTSFPTQTTRTPAANTSAIRVYNISAQEGLAARTVDRLKAGGFSAAPSGNLYLPNVTATTVYFSDAPGERDAADAVGQLLGAPVEPRIPEVADQPPGVIVVVTG
jgi:serine/threonine protein kinase